MRLRRLPVRTSDVSLRGLLWESARDKVEDVLNALLGHARDRIVVLPKMEQSTDPESGELLYDGSRCWVVIDGTYCQLWPHPETRETTTIIEEGGGGGDGYPPTAEREIAWVAVTFSTSTWVELVPAVPGKRIRVCYLEMSNTDTSDRICGVKYSSATQTLCSAFLAKNGGTVVQNFFGTELTDGDVGDSLNAICTSSVGGNIYYTVGYFYQD